MSYNVKNYTEQGGEVTRIGGRLVIEEGGSVEGLPSPVIPKAENQADSTASTVAALVTDFNGLLAKLKTAGLMEADEESAEEPQPEPEIIPDEPEGSGDNGENNDPPAQPGESNNDEGAPEQ